MVQQKVRLSNQLTNTLKDYFPQAVKAFGSITNKCALRFLSEIDTFLGFDIMSLYAWSAGFLLIQEWTFDRITILELQRWFSKDEVKKRIIWIPVKTGIHDRTIVVVLGLNA